MPTQKPLGIYIFGGLFTFIGGVTTLLLIIDIIDSLRFAGFDSILINNYDSFAGFLLYGCTPILFYFSGVGLFMSRKWARKLTIFTIPILTGFLSINMASHIAQSQVSTHYSDFFTLLFNNLHIFFTLFFIYLLINLPLLIYFNNLKIILYFEKIEQ